jgi:acetyl-CoA C-acetyltransferase
VADYALDDKGTTYRNSFCKNIRSGYQLHASRRQLSGVVDGSAAIPLASPDYAKAHGLKPRARVVAMANMGDYPP